MGDLEGIQCAFQRRVFLIQSKKAVFREGHCGRIAGEFFQAPGKGAGLRRAQQPFDVGADFAFEAQGIGPVMVHGQQEHGGEHVGIGGLPDVEARIARLLPEAYSSRSSCGKSALRVRIRFTSRSVLRRLSMRWATAWFVPARIPFNSFKLFFIFSLTPGSTASASRLSSTFSGKRPGLDFLHDSEVDETVAAQDAVVEDALRPLALLADVGSDGHVGQSDVDGFVRLFGQHLEELEQRNEERATARGRTARAAGRCGRRCSCP